MLATIIVYSLWAASVAVTVAHVRDARQCRTGEPVENDE
jgi:hypothetical protein